MGSRTDGDGFHRHGWRVEVGLQAYDAGDYQRAKDILLPLAERGHPKAMNLVGHLYDGTNAFPNDLVKKCDWFERAANAGYANAMYNMSICYDGFGRPDDPEMDQKWLLKAADHGVIYAMINLAGMDTTQGDEYRRWMIQAAEQGSRYALVDLWLS